MLLGMRKEQIITGSVHVVAAECLAVGATLAWSIRRPAHQEGPTIPASCITLICFELWDWYVVFRHKGDDESLLPSSRRVLLLYQFVRCVKTAIHPGWAIPVQNVTKSAAA